MGRLPPPPLYPRSQDLLLGLISVVVDNIPVTNFQLFSEQSRGIYTTLLRRTGDLLLTPYHLGNRFSPPPDCEEK